MTTQLLTQEIIAYYIDAVNSEGSGLNQVETFVMRSITELHGSGVVISPQSQRILERIYKEKVR
jgi:hypothetical protein